MKSILVALLLALTLFNTSQADTLIKMDRTRLRGKLSLIADTYVEFTVEKNSGQQQWLKVDKKEILVILDHRKKLLYPRDKYDEIALNYGKVKLRTAQDVQKYKQRKTENSAVQAMQEQTEKNRLKTAAVIGGLGGIMAWVFVQGK
jgi:hypothetical protein